MICGGEKTVEDTGTSLVEWRIIAKVGTSFHNGGDHR
jgi:hypothetical protein